VDDVVAIDGLVAGTVAAEVPVVADEPLEDDRVPAVPEFPVHVGGRHDIALVEVTVMSPKLVVADAVPVVADDEVEVPLDELLEVALLLVVHVGGRHDITLVEVTVMSPKLVVADAVAEVRVVADVLEDDCVPCCMVLLTFCPQQSTLVTHPEVS